MKLSLPTPVIVGVLVLVVLVIGFFLFRASTAEVEAPKPDASQYLPKTTNAAPGNAPGTPAPTTP